MTKLNKTIKIWFILSISFIILLFMWVSIHELSHASVCKLLGNTPKLEVPIPYVKINCVGIVEENKLLVGKNEYFFLSMMPYIVMLLLLITSFFTKRYLVGQYLVTIIFLMDTLFNYMSSAVKVTDFRNLAIVDVKLFYDGALITCFIFVIGIIKLIKDWPEIKEKIKGGLNE